MRTKFAVPERLPRSISLLTFQTTLIAALFGAAALLFSVFAAAQTGQQQKPLVPLATSTTPHRTRLILKDGSYQVIMSYRIVGSVVHYISAERGGAEEEIPPPS